MPVHDYKCSKCGVKLIDIIVIPGVDDMDDRIKDGIVECPKCKTQCTKMICSNYHFRLMGDGWTPKFSK